MGERWQDSVKNGFKEKCAMPKDGFFPEQMLTLCLAALGERKWQGKQRQREGGGKEKGIASLFVCFRYREERREECAFYWFGLLKEQNKKHILYLNLTYMPLCKKFFGMKYKGTRGMEVFLKCKTLCSPPFPPNLRGQKNVGLDENCICPHHLSSPSHLKPYAATYSLFSHFIFTSLLYP